MKKIYSFLVLLFVLFSVNSYAQCDLDPDCQDPEGDGEVCPENMPDAVEATPYNESVTIVTASEVDGAPIHHLELVDVLNIPPGMGYTCQDDICTFYPEEPRCVLLYGTPEVGSYGDYELGIIVEVFISVFGSPVSIGEMQEDVIVEILPKVSSNFEISNLICSGEVYTITYTGNATPDADYTWDFDDGVVLSGSGQGPYMVRWDDLGDQTVSLLVYEDDFWSPLNEHKFTVLNCTGVDDLSEQSFEVYPNPTEGFVQYTINYHRGSNPLMIYDLYGRLVYEEDVQNVNQGVIDLSSFAKGCYLVQYENYRQKLIVQ